MKLKIIIYVCFFYTLMGTSLSAKKQIDIDFNNLSIKDFLKISSKLMKKNILISEKVSGKVDFISNKPIYKEDLLYLVIYVLESKGFTLVENNNILRVIRLENASQYNIPVSNNSKNQKHYMMITEVFDIQNNDVEYISSKVQHLLSTNAKLVTHKDSHTIVLTDFPSNINTVKKIISLILQENQNLSQTVVDVLYLKNAEAKNVLKILTNIINNKKYKDPNHKSFVSIDEESNSIILMGTREEIKYLKILINKIDIDKQQVYVKAKIIEVNEKKVRDVGIKYGLQGFSKSTGSLSSFSSSLNGGKIVNLNSLSTYGFSLSSMNRAMTLGMSLNLLHQNGAADIVSEPSLLCINNKESSIYVGETISIKTGTTTTSSGIPTDTYTREDIGLTLKVKPRISSGNKVLLNISTKMEDVSQTATNENPNTSKKDLITTAIVNNGESIILGGYIRKRVESSEEKVPLLGDLPLVGGLFKNNKSNEDKINLVVIITPYIVPKSKDLSFIRERLSQLKMIEDKYTKDTILRLKKAKELAKRQDFLRDKKMEKMDGKLNITFEEKQTENEKQHQKRVNKLLGL